MDYNHIKNFLEKFKKIIFLGDEINKKIIEIITQKTSFPVELNMIKIKGDIIYIQGPSMLRSEILMRKELILSELSKTITERNFRDIR
jgi:hypothetical protein